MKYLTYAKDKQFYKFIGIVFIIFNTIFFSSNALSITKNKACITKYKYQLEKGGYSGGLFCKNGTTFTRVDVANKRYIVYNYIYRFMPHPGGVFHGGQRIIFFNPNYEYLGQFVLSPPPDVILLPGKDKLTLIGDPYLTGDKKPVGEILLTSPPKCTFEWEELEFFK
jgi:hypothetical protein